MSQSPSSRPDSFMSGLFSLVTSRLGKTGVESDESFFLRVAVALSSARQDHVLEDLTQSLVELLGVDAALIGVHGRGEARQQIKAWAFLCDGQWIAEPSSLLAGTPCETVLDQDFCYYEQGVQSSFADALLREHHIEGYAGVSLRRADGESLGVIAVMTHEPLRLPEQVEATLRIFAARIAVEVERAETAAALRASDELYATVFKATLDGLAILAPGGEIIDVNPALVQMSGYSREDLLGRRLHDLASGQHSLSTLLASALTDERACGEGELIRHDGSTLYVEHRSARVPFRGQPHVLQIVRDLSDRRKAERERLALEAQLRQAQRMETIGQLTGGIAHDFNNLLTGLLGYLEMARERAERHADERLTRYCDRAIRSGGRARELIQQMLTFSRGARSKARPVDLAVITRETISLLESTLPSSIEMITDIPPGTPPISLEPIHFQQVLMNLCINARDAMEGEGRLVIRLSENRQDECFSCTSCHLPVDGQFLELTISDNGPGIPPELLQRVFEPFFSTKEPGKGTGMGLAIVHGIVHEYGGHLTVHSTPGIGTTVRVFLPLPTAALEPQPRENRRPAESEPGPGLNARVLLVDDDANVAEYVQELLEGWGCQVSVWRESPAAAAHFARHAENYDLVVLDQTMPHLSGLDLARQIHIRRPELPVVLYTGYSESLTEERVREAGIRALVRKPLDRSAFRQVLENLLQPVGP